MEPKIGTLTIKGFRAFRELKIEGLGRVNLITGRNNTGKSSVLEALRILASNGSPAVVYSILRFREEDTGEPEESALPLDAEYSFPWLSLFHDFPEPFSECAPIFISATGCQSAMEVSLASASFKEEGYVTDSGSMVNVELPVLSIKGDGVARLLSVDSLRQYWKHRHLLQMRGPDEPNLLSVFVHPYEGAQTSTLGPLWDGIALSDDEKHVVEGLRIIDSNISAVSMVGGDKTRQTRTAIVRSTTLSHPVPLRSFGDGLNRLFGIILSLVNAKNGLLLIDEFENGMHHTVQLDVWRAIFRLSRQLDIQVFATSHSWDAVEAFQKAASEAPDEGVLVRLTRKGENIIPTVLRKDELAIATRDHIEVR